MVGKINIKKSKKPIPARRMKSSNIGFNLLDAEAQLDILRREAGGATRSIAKGKLQKYAQALSQNPTKWKTKNFETVVRLKRFRSMIDQLK
jgi:hypothetical protein